MPRTARVTTAVEGLDAILGGGLPAAEVVGRRTSRCCRCCWGSLSCVAAGSSASIDGHGRPPLSEARCSLERSSELQDGEIAAAAAHDL